MIKSEGAGLLPLDILAGFQGNLKKLTTKNRDRLAKSILNLGFIAPIFIWKDRKEYKILDGHQRVATLNYLQDKGWDIPDIPVAYIEADTEEDARRKLLHITSQYGDFLKDELKEWVAEFEADLASTMRFADGELNLLKDMMDGTGLDGEGYSKRIESPIYEVKGKRPKLTELVDTTKTDALIKQIKDAGLTDKKLERFLIRASYRHLDFSYESIAEYYAHADPVTQGLMEKSALIIIDFDKAVENGFVDMVDEFVTVYDEGHDL